MIRRRQFITLLGGVAASWPLVARAQQALPVIGYVGGGSGRGVFRKGLNESGYVDGRNVAIEYRSVEAHYERLPSILTDLIQRRVDVIAAVDSTAAAQAAKAATQTIPIVFRIGGDPVAAGLVASLNHPGGNLTGISTLGNPLGQKQLELLHEVLPAGAAVAVLANPANANTAREIEELQSAARILNIRPVIFNVGNLNDLEATFMRLDEKAIAGILPMAEPLFFQQSEHLVALVARQGIPAIYTDRVFAEAGGLMSYGTDIPEGFRQAGIYTARILKGEKPADLPIIQSTKFEFVVNLKTAKALGLTIPESILLRADEVIE